MSSKFLSRKPVWYNIGTGKSYTHKPHEVILKHCKYFPSTAEYKLFCCMKSILPNDNFTLHTQSYLYAGAVRWRIDFALTSDVHDFNSLACKYNVSSTSTPCRKLYIEYKGMHDKNFMQKQRNLTKYPEKDSTLVLVAQHKSKVYDKIIYDVNTFLDILNSWLTTLK